MADDRIRGSTQADDKQLKAYIKPSLTKGAVLSKITALQPASGGPT
jgi:hypothetical protein